MFFFVGRGSVEYLGVWSLVIRWIFVFFRWLFGSVIFFQSCKRVENKLCFQMEVQREGEGVSRQLFFFES